MVMPGGSKRGGQVPRRGCQAHRAGEKRRHGEMYAIRSRPVEASMSTVTGRWAIKRTGLNIQGPAVREPHCLRETVPNHRRLYRTVRGGTTPHLLLCRGHTPVLAAASARAWTWGAPPIRTASRRWWACPRTPSRACVPSRTVARRTSRGIDGPGFPTVTVCGWAEVEGGLR